MMWDEAFDNMDLLDEKKDNEIAAIGLCAWAICCMGGGGKPHKNFGHVMVKIGKRLGIAPTGDNLSKWADEYIAKKKEQ